MNLKSRAEILRSNPYIDLKNQWILHNVDAFIAKMEENLSATSETVDEKLYACFSLLIFQAQGVPSVNISLNSLLIETIALGRRYIKALPQFWHENMLVVMNVAMIQGDKDTVTEFSDWFQSTQFQQSASNELRATIPILFQIANLCRSEPPMDLKPIFDDLAYCKVKPDSATQKGIAALAEGNPSDTHSNLVKSATRALTKINLILKAGKALSPYNKHLLSHALVWNCAEFKGMRLDLPPPLHPFMITRQSLGIERA